MGVDPIKRGVELRKTLKLDDKILVVNFNNTLQGKDTSKVIDLMPNIKTNEHVFRAKVNVKKIDPIAAKKYNLEFFDVKKHGGKEIEDLVKRSEFDFPLWYKHNDDFNIKEVANYNMPFIVQLGGCNFHDGNDSGGCWYCFVDNKSNNGEWDEVKTCLGTEDTIDSMLDAREKINKIYKKYNQNINIKVLRISGGEPTLVLDWVLDLWRKISENELDFVGQLDSNLSTSVLINKFEKKEIYERDILEKLAEYPIKILAAVKGTDEENLQSNVQADATIEMQEISLKKFIKSGNDVFIQIYNPNPSTLEKYLSSMDKKIENFSLRSHIGPLKVKYGPTKKRLTLEAKRLNKNPEDYIKEREKEWDSNYKNSCGVIDSYLRKNYKVGYREIVRSDVELKVKNFLSKIL